MIIKSAGDRTTLNLGDVWEYRGLLYFLVWRDLKVRYKQTVLGAGWAVIQPFFSMVVFSIFFGHLGKIPSDGVPYPIFAYTALVPWQLFSNSLTECSNSLVQNKQLITKVYFPRLIIPLSCVIGGLVDFAIAFGILLLMALFFGIKFSLALLSIPLLIGFTLLTALSIGIWLAALNAKYRDFRYTLPFTIQLWLFASPIAYPSSLVPEKWRLLYGLNPMAGVVDGFRWAVLGNAPMPGPSMIVSALVVCVTTITGLYYFRKIETTVADSI